MTNPRDPEVDRGDNRPSWGFLRGRFRADGLATPGSGATRPYAGPGEAVRSKGLNVFSS